MSRRNGPRFLFTYGSLMSGLDCEVGREERRCLDAAARRVGPASIRGLMFDVGPYPAAVLAPGQRLRIHGEIWELDRDRPDAVAALLAVLDRYEGCAADSPVPHAYRRCRVRIGSGTGGSRRVVAWMYVWNREVAGLPVIGSGRWRPDTKPAAEEPAASLRDAA